MESYEKDWFVILMLILCFPVGLFLMWKYSKCHKIVKTIISVLLIAIVILSNGIKKPKNIETKDTNVEVETLTVDERKELQEKSKIILDNKDYYTMNEDERKTINELVKRWNDEIDYNFKSEYLYKKALYEMDKYYDEITEEILKYDLLYISR